MSDLPPFHDLRPGDVVRVRADDGTVSEYVVRDAPWQLGHGAWVVGLRGMSGGYDLSRVIERVVPAAERADRLAEALSWAVGFIRCHHPQVESQYPDMRNALDLVGGRFGRLSGEFHRACCRAELAEVERDRLANRVRELEAALKPFADGAKECDPFFAGRDRPCVATVDDYQRAAKVLRGE